MSGMCEKCQSFILERDPMYYQDMGEEVGVMNDHMQACGALGSDADFGSGCEENGKPVQGHASDGNLHWYLSSPPGNN